MKERLLIEFLEGRGDVARLRETLVGAYTRSSHDVLSLGVEFAQREHVVTREGMLRVCTAVLSGDLDPALLEPIGDCLMMSETFRFDEQDRELLADVAHAWGAPEIGWPLDIPRVRIWQTWLETGREPGG